MATKSLDHLGKLQRAIVELVWEHGEATVRQVWERLSSKRTLAYTTILTSMQRLEKAGWLQHRVEGVTNVYTATRTREEAGVTSVEKLVQRIFHGNALLMFQHFVEKGGLSDQELLDLRRMIDKKRKEKRK